LSFQAILAIFYINFNCEILCLFQIQLLFRSFMNLAKKLQKEIISNQFRFKQSQMWTYSTLLILFVR